MKDVTENNTQRKKISYKHLQTLIDQEETDG